MASRFYTNGLLNLALAHKALGHKELAVKYMQEAVDSDPTADYVKEEFKNLNAH